MALLGCDVVSTDQTEVLPLLMRNVERNTSRIMQTISDPGFKLMCHLDLFSFLNCIFSIICRTFVCKLNFVLLTSSNLILRGCS